MSEALKQIERAMDDLARMHPLDRTMDQRAIEEKFEAGLGHAREEWRRLKTVEARLNRLIERISWLADRYNTPLFSTVHNQLHAALREAREEPKP